VGIAELTGQAFCSGRAALFFDQQLPKSRRLLGKTSYSSKS
jgi:hypothetical protein